MRLYDIFSAEKPVEALLQTGRLPAGFTKLQGRLKAVIIAARCRNVISLQTQTQVNLIQAAPILLKFFMQIVQICRLHNKGKPFKIAASPVFFKWIEQTARGTNYRRFTE